MTDRVGGRPTSADLEGAAASVVEREWGRRPSRVRRVSSDVEETFLIEFEGARDSEPTRAVLKIAEPEVRHSLATPGAPASDARTALVGESRERRRIPARSSDERVRLGIRSTRNGGCANQA
jgi:hypothetical protein